MRVSMAPVSGELERACTGPSIVGVEVLTDAAAASRAARARVMMAPRRAGVEVAVVEEEGIVFVPYHV